MSEEITHQFPKDGFTQILARFDSVDSRLTALEEKVDRRLMETRPIWEQVLARLDAIESRLDAIETRVGTIETRVGAIEATVGLIESRLDRIDDELHDQNRKVRMYLKDVVRLQDDQEDLDERVRKLESTPAV